MANTIIECIGLCKAFDGVRAIDHVQIRFGAGKVSAIVGPNGSGKTTFFHLISGFVRPDNGTIWLRNNRIDHLPRWQIARMGVGRLFQDVRVFRDLTVLENVLVAFPDQAEESIGLSVISRRAIRRQESSLTDKAASLLSEVGLNNNIESKAAQMSFGEQKLLAVAMLLAKDSDVLLLDEPTAGISSTAIHRLCSLIQRLSVEGKTILLIEHNLDVVEELADEVYVMDRGQLVPAV